MSKFIAFGLLLVLGGCAASQCNPGTAGFFSGLGCAVGNGYAQRRQALGAEATQANATASYYDAEASRSEAARQAALTELASERDQLATMQHEQQELARRLAADATEHGATKAELDEAERKLAALRHATENQAKTGTPDPAAVARLRAKQQRLLALVAKM